MPNLDYCVPTYYVVAPAECSSNLSRFDGVRFGHRAEDPEDLLDLYCRSRGEGFGAEVQAPHHDGHLRVCRPATTMRTTCRHRRCGNSSATISQGFRVVDVIAGPTTPTPAFKLGDKTDDPITMYLNDIYTIGANLAGLPGMSTPCGFVDGLPVGLHLVGPHWSEETLLRTAHQYQQQTDWHTQCPGGYE